MCCVIASHNNLVQFKHMVHIAYTFFFHTQSSNRSHRLNMYLITVIMELVFFCSCCLWYAQFRLFCFLFFISLTFVVVETLPFYKSFFVGVFVVASPVQIIWQRKREYSIKHTIFFVVVVVIMMIIIVIVLCLYSFVVSVLYKIYKNIYI